MSESKRSPARGMVTKTVANLDAKGKPSPEEYAALREGLAEISSWLQAHRFKIGHAIVPDSGKSVMRQDVVDWTSWIAKEQLDGLAVWLDEAEHGGQAETLMEALKDAEERILQAENRAVEAEEYADSVAASAAPSQIKTHKIADEASLAVREERNVGTAAKVVADGAQEAIVYDDDDPKSIEAADAELE